MPLLPLDYLHHILDETEFVLSHMQGLTLEQFMRAPTLQRAFVRSIEIIGEATKKAPGELRLKYPQIDWKSMAGMRDRLVHDYFGIDYEIVWDVVQNKIPTLKHEIERIIQQETRQ